MYFIRVEDTFSAAHYITNFSGKCESLHGHNYRIRVSVGGKELDKGGMLVSFESLKEDLADIIKELDHCLLNELKEFSDGNPSSERIAFYVYNKMQKKQPDNKIIRVEVFENESAMAAYCPD
jgi:6-pyruvoyltetrahydropterin/6-carboxytetrahydropterin synthase